MNRGYRVWRRLLAPVENIARRQRELLVRLRDPDAFKLYSQLVATGYQPNHFVDVLPEHRIIYVCLYKCASTRIRMTLSEVLGRSLAVVGDAHHPRKSGLKGPKRVGISRFKEIATDPAALRFTFVRNPYARLVSAWAKHYRGKRLVAGDAWVDQYLKWQKTANGSFPIGTDYYLSFADFARFASATAVCDLNRHWQRQSDFVQLPGIALNFIGKVEAFSTDFQHVLDHVKAEPSLRGRAVLPLNVSSHELWPSYYTGGLADCVYQAYEQDFDRFKYPRSFETTCVGASE